MSDREEAITIVDGERRQHAVDGLSTVPAIGSGIFLRNVFCRVADVWFNAAGDQEPLPYGWIVRVELAASSDHPPKEFAPDYYNG